MATTEETARKVKSLVAYQPVRHDEEQSDNSKLALPLVGHQCRKFIQKAGV